MKNVFTISEAMGFLDIRLDHERSFEKKDLLALCLLADLIPLQVYEILEMQKQGLESENSRIPEQMEKYLLEHEDDLFEWRDCRDAFVSAANAWVNSDSEDFYRFFLERTGHCEDLESLMSVSEIQCRVDNFYNGLSVCVPLATKPEKENCYLPLMNRIKNVNKECTSADDCSLTVLKRDNPQHFDSLDLLDVESGNFLDQAVEEESAVAVLRMQFDSGEMFVRFLERMKDRNVEYVNLESAEIDFAVNELKNGLSENLPEEERFYFGEDRLSGLTAENLVVSKKLIQFPMICFDEAAKVPEVWISQHPCVIERLEKRSLS